jgi:hypothetical protein
MLMGQSNAVGTRPKTELTDLRYDLTQTDVRQWTRLNGVNGSTTTSAMSIPANQSSLEPAFGYLLRNTAGEWPIIFRAAGSGYSLETTWNPSGAGNEWANAVAHLWACYEQAKTEFAGDTIEFGSLVWWNAEAAANRGGCHPFPVREGNEISRTTQPVSVVKGPWISPGGRLA